jgi:hypothetical protein
MTYISVINNIHEQVEEKRNVTTPDVRLMEIVPELRLLIKKYRCCRIKTNSSRVTKLAEELMVEEYNGR